MSIWGKRVDGLFTPHQRADRQSYNRAGLNALWQIALVVLVAVLATMIVYFLS